MKDFWQHLWQKHKLQLIFLCSGGALLLAIFILLFSLRHDGEEVATAQKPVVGLVLYGNSEEAGWNKQHFVGAHLAAKRFGIKLIVTDDVTFDEKRARQALEEMAARGYDFTIATSAEFTQSVQDIRANGSRMQVAIPRLDAPGEGESLSDEALIKLDWYTEGVKFL